TTRTNNAGPLAEQADGAGVAAILPGEIGDDLVRQHQPVQRTWGQRQLERICAQPGPVQMRTARLRRLQRAALLRRGQRRREIDRGPPRAREWSGVTAPGGLGDMARATADLDDAAASRSDAPRAETLQQCFAVAPSAQRGVREAQQVGDGALDFVEAPPGSEAVPAMVRAVRILHRASARGTAHAAFVAPGGFALKRSREAAFGGRSRTGGT